MSERPIPPSGEQHQLALGDQEAVVVEVGGALRRYAVGGREVLDGYGEQEQVSGARGQTMIPWPNRLRDGRYEHAGATHQLPLSEPQRENAIHGLVRWSPWRAVEREPHRVTMAQRLHAQDGWPFALDLRIAYELRASGLTVTTSAENVCAAPCPVAFGAHPYVTVGTGRVDEAVLRAPGAVRLLTDERGIPTDSAPVDGTPYDFRAARPIGSIELDTAFTRLERGGDGRARVDLAAPDGGWRVRLWMDEAYAWLMLFTGDPLPDPDARRRSLGVEPMTCPPNGLQSGEGVRLLEPGERFAASWGISASATAAVM